MIIAVGEIPYRVSVQSQNVAGCGIKEVINCFTLEGGEPHLFQISLGGYFYSASVRHVNSSQQTNEMKTII